MNKHLSAFFTIILLCTLLTSCLSFPPKTDEELIRECMDAFITAYNTGDAEGCLECLDAKSINAMKSTSSLIGSIGFGIGGFSFGINPLELFGLAVANASEEDLLDIQILDIEIESDKRATVYTKFAYTDKYNSIQGLDCNIVMTKEDGDWFIKDIVEK